LSTVRIAHFSDTHVLSLDGVGPREFLNKRFTGAVNLALNRSKHYQVEVFERLLDAVVAAAPDHSVCTGDLVNLALEPEFTRVQGLLADRFPADALTLVPGNHDYYVKDAVVDGRFERFFGRWLSRDIETPEDVTYPVTRLLPGVAIVGLNSAIITPVFMARGAVAERQLALMKSLFSASSVEDRFRLLLLHHPLLPEPTRRFDAMRRLENAGDVIDAIRNCGQNRPQLVVHGHNHVYKEMTVPGTEIPIVQVASASRAGVGKYAAEFNIYVIRDGVLVDIERHIHDRPTGRFIASDRSGRALEKHAP